MKEFVKKLKKLAKTMLIYCVRVFCPVKKRKIYFLSNDGNRYACNPKAFFEYLYNNHKDEFEFVYCISDESKHLIPQGVKTTKKYTLKNIYHFQTAGIIISNFRINWTVNKRKKQYYIQTWHGGPVPQKMIEKDAISDLTEKYIAMAKKDAQNTNLLMTGSDAIKEAYRTAFWYDGEISNFGTPRYDIFFKNNEEFSNKLREQLKIEKDTKIILYAPTFRNCMSPDELVLNNKIILRAFENYYKSKVVLMYRFHPNQTKETKDMTFEDERIMNLTSYPDAVDLEIIADVLITDFSSTLADFMMLRKPCFIFSKEYEQYISSERKLYIDCKEYPYPMVESEEKLEEYIVKNKDLENKFTKDIDAFNKRIGLTENGKACESLYVKIKKDVFKEEVWKR